MSNSVFLNLSNTGFLISVGGLNDGTIGATHANTSIVRGIDLIEDGRPGHFGAIRTAADVLDPLDATALALLRRAGHAARLDGAPLFHCAVCANPVHIRVQGVQISGQTGGRRAVFVHDPRKNARFCPAGNLSDGTSAAAIDAQRFQGRQEGARHAFLKFQLQDSLERDPVFRNVGAEQIVRDANGNWRRPDVLASTAWGRIGFDVQLAPPLLDSIIGRQRFYANADVGHLWVVDAANPECLNRQGFLDVVLPQGAVVLGFDEHAAAVSADSGELMMHLMTVSEDTDRRRFNVSSELIGRDLILDLAGLRRPSAAPIAADLRAAAMFTALRDGDVRVLQSSFEALAEGCDAPGFLDAGYDELFAIIAVLATLVTGRKADASGFSEDAVNAIVNQHLRSEQSGMRPNFVRRAWAPVIARAAFHPNVRRWIDKPGTKTRPLLDAALIECAEDPEFSSQLINDWVPLLDRLFPSLRLAGLKELIAPPLPD